MSRQRIPIQELKLKIVAELDRELGSRGTVLDLDVEDLHRHGDGPNWGITRISEEADQQALNRVLASVVPRLQAEYDADFG